MRTFLAVLFLLGVSSVANADPHWHGHWGGGGWGGNNAASSFWGGVAGGILGNLLQPPPVVVQPPVIVQQPPMVVMPAPAVPELQPWTGSWYQACANHYRTFDARSGNYMGFDGQPHFCNG